MLTLILCAIATGDCPIVRQQIVTQAVVAPVAYPAFIYSAGDYERLRKLEMIAEQNAAIMQQQAQIVQALTASGQMNAAPPASKLETSARAIIKANCLKCHSGPQPKGNLDMTGPISTAQKLLIAQLVESGAMPPPPAKPLADDDFNQLRAWSVEDRAAVRATLKAATKGEKK